MYYCISCMFMLPLAYERLYSVYIVYTDYVRPCSRSKAANLPIATTQSMLHRTYCRAAITPNFAPVEHVSARFLWPAEGATICKDPGSGIEVSNCIPSDTL